MTRTFASQYRPGRYNRSRNSILQDATFVVLLSLIVLGGVTLVVAWSMGAFS